MKKKKLLAGALSAAMIAGSMSVSSLAAAPAAAEAAEMAAETNVSDVFNDISDSSWYHDAVQYVYDNGIMTGTTTNTFGPTKLISRAQFATMLYRLSGETVSYTSVFPDVSDGKFYSLPVTWANKAGVITGYSNGMFGPADNMTREMLATMLYRYAGYKDYDTVAYDDLSSFPDASQVSSFAKDAMSWCVATGIITGTQGKLAPRATATRAETATMFMRFMELVVNTEPESDPVEEAMTSASIGGVTYYYADTEGDAANTVYTASVTTGRGPSATTTVYNYSKADLTQAADSSEYYIVAPGTNALDGTLYGYTGGEVTSYKDVYADKATATDDPAYDAVSSATHLTHYHAKDIASIVAYGSDADGNKTIAGVTLNRNVKTVDAKTYVDASVLKAAGKDLTAEQTDALDITLKANPASAPSEETKAVQLASASYVASSNYGEAEFDLIPDDSVEGYVWNEYWNNVYGATISDGTTTVGAVHWIDLYGENAASGYHYNKLQLALNNGTSVGENQAEVSRYAAFFDANTGNLKAGTYTITVYSEGYENLTAEVTIAAEELASVSVGGQTYYYADTDGDDANTVYTATVRSRAGSTVYNYTQADMTMVTDSTVGYVLLPGVTDFTGTLYGYTGGTVTSYKDVYADKATEMTDPAYDAVSSATAYTSNHAKDIASIVNVGTDAAGVKVITGVKLGRTTTSVDAKTYVEGSILNAAGKELTEAQSAAVSVTLKADPQNAPAEVTKSVVVTTAAKAENSNYGLDEFDLTFDTTVENFVWSEYWNNVYAATISDGTTTVGAVHWIDMYGENATSGYHYNKLQIALNNGTSEGSNLAQVSRYAAFYDEANTLKPGTYTITIYAEGYETVTAAVVVE